MIKTHEQNNHESKLTSAEGVALNERVKEEEGDGSELEIERF